MFGPDTFKAHLFHDLSHTVYRQRFLDAAIDLLEDGGGGEPYTLIRRVGEVVVAHDELFLGARCLKGPVALVEGGNLLLREPVAETADAYGCLRIELHIVDM